MHAERSTEDRSGNDFNAKHACREYSDQQNLARERCQAKLQRQQLWSARCIGFVGNWDGARCLKGRPSPAEHDYKGAAMRVFFPRQWLSSGGSFHPHDMLQGFIVQRATPQTVGHKAFPRARQVCSSPLGLQWVATSRRSPGPPVNHVQTLGERQFSGSSPHAGLGSLGAALGGISTSPQVYAAGGVPRGDDQLLMMVNSGCW